MLRSWKEFAQRRTLRAAIKQTLRQSKSKKNLEKGGYTFVFPHDPQQAKVVVGLVRDWIGDHPGGPIRVILPVQAKDIARKLKSGVKTVTYDMEEDSTRLGVPTRELRRIVSHLQANVAVLLSDQNDPFEEILFALINANLKAALFAESRIPYAELLVQAKGEHGQVKKIQLLLDAISTFGQEQVETKQNSESARRAKRSFSTPKRDEKSA